MKKLVRILLKIPGTMLLVPFWLIMLLTGYAVQFIEWAYEARDFDKRITAELIQEYKNNIKRWFTTL
jgi:hypothetical protein